MIPMLKDSRLYNVARVNSLLKTLTIDSIDPAFFDLCEKTYPREEEYLDATRVIIVVDHGDGENHVITACWPKRLESHIPIDVLIESGYQTLKPDCEYDIDEIVTRCLWAASVGIGDDDYFKQPENRQLFLLDQIGGLCMIAYDDPLDIVMYLKPHPDEQTKSPTVDWIWYKSR